MHACVCCGKRNCEKRDRFVNDDVANVCVQEADRGADHDVEADEPEETKAVDDVTDVYQSLMSSYDNHLACAGKVVPVTLFPVTRDKSYVLFKIRSVLAHTLRSQ